MLNSNELINKIKGYNKFLNLEKLDKAYNFAVKAHQNQKRASGDPYSVHPIEVANILTDLKLDSATITTGLLHDTIEDTFATYETIKSEFGDEVADLVDGVTKISVFENTAGGNSKVENFRKLILATSKDIRVLLVKIADRLHNMRTIKAITKEEKRKRIAQETMEIYAPLADRMGMHRIRDELEDLSFEILNYEARKLIKEKLDEIKLDRKDIFEELSFKLSEILNQHHSSYKGSKLSPFSNRIPKGKYSYNEVDYQFSLNEEDINSLHGFLHNQPFDVIAIEENDSSAELILGYHYNGIAKGYPFAYDMRIIYRYDARGFEVITEITNTCGSVMPIGDGWHPYYRFEDIDQIKLKLGRATRIASNFGNGLNAKHGFEELSTIGDLVMDDCFKIEEAGSEYEIQIENQIIIKIFDLEKKSH